jgi:bifunctional DNA-binding transcriptional regulator/antitoxin component of YhaV-PrlF toxin-antitoxin module
MTERRTWLCEIDDDGILTFPDELMNLQGWKEGDDINFDILPDGTLILTKVEPNEPQDHQGEPDSADGN